jgi:histidinol-phosphate phosphatase family protein
MTSYDVVIPTSGRPSLPVLLAALAGGVGPLPGRVVVVDDRAAPGPTPLELHVSGALAGRIEVVRGRRRGPAAARNDGWHACDAAWIAFLDDDVIPQAGWRAILAADLGALAPRVAGTQGRIRVPLRRDRRPTDWERNVAGLQDARWATADLAYRRSALAATGGFDERFPRAYREDSDLGLRLTGLGLEIARGRRSVLHPVGVARPAVSLHKQEGNADDALMRALHGPGWRTRAGAHRGRLPWHAATAGAGMLALMLVLARRRSAAKASGALWGAGTAELAWRRIAPGPRTPGEVGTMIATTPVLPFLAVRHRLEGALRARRLTAATSAPRPERPAAVLLDRDGTLVHDVPYNGDPTRVAPLRGAREALDRLRAAGVPVAVVSNQSGVARGTITRGQVDAVNARIEELLGPFGSWHVCPHGPQDGCGCRKPEPGLLLAAAGSLGVAPARCAMIGDIGADVEAAAAVGARPVLVPTAATRREEIEAAPERAASLGDAVELLLAGTPAPAADARRVAQGRRGGGVSPGAAAA